MPDLPHSTSLGDDYMPFPRHRECSGMILSHLSGGRLTLWSQIRPCSGRSSESIYQVPLGHLTQCVLEIHTPRPLRTPGGWTSVPQEAASVTLCYRQSIHSRPSTGQVSLAIVTRKSPCDLCPYRPQVRWGRHPLANIFKRNIDHRL